MVWTTPKILAGLALLLAIASIFIPGYPLVAVGVMLVALAVILL